MPSFKHPPSNKDEVIQRLINENKQQNTQLQELKFILYSEPEFEGLSMVGGMRSLIKAYREEKQKVWALEAKIKQLEAKL